MKARMLWSSLFISVVISIAAWQVGQGNAIYVQAWLAKNLLQPIWIRAQPSSNRQHSAKPWFWASNWPVARLSIPHLNLEHVILACANEGMSPFALGHADSSVLPGELGNSVLNAHRDTYFKLLQVLKLGDILILESPRSGKWRYRVSAIYVVDKTDTRLLTPTVNRRLTLVSQYPSKNGKDSLRYVVVAEEVERVLSTSARAEIKG